MVDCRRILKWTYCFGYYRFAENATSAAGAPIAPDVLRQQQEFFEFNQARTAAALAACPCTVLTGNALFGAATPASCTCLPDETRPSSHGLGQPGRDCKCLCTPSFALGQWQRIMQRCGVERRTPAVA